MKSASCASRIVTCQICHSSKFAARSARLSSTQTRSVCTSPPKDILPRLPPSTQYKLPNRTATWGHTLSTTLRQQRPGAGAKSGAGDPALELAQLQERASKITAANSVPEELDVLELLEACHTFANLVIFGRLEDATSSAQSAARKAENTAGASLLELDESSNTQAVSAASSDLTMSFRQTASEVLSELVYKLLRDPKVYITQAMLELHVRIEALLGKPEYMPEIFQLYATKPIPNPGSSPISYRRPWPGSPKNAIPPELSDAALDGAVRKKDLSLALSIIDTTVCAPAFRNAKLLRKGSIPGVALGVMPVCIYAAASFAADLQITYDVQTAKYMAVAAITAYVGTLATVGFVAVTTSNDQMERVVWQPGLRLRDRWLREEERLYFDRIAMAWGFKERWRRGEEQGEEWEALREFVGRRQMILDKTDLLEGME